VVAGALQVLLVEDNPDDAELIELELCRNGYLPTITRVETGEEMAAALAGGGWDIVLSDFNLPSFSAERALDTLRASGQDLPFIILSGVVQAEDAVSLLKRGAHDFLNKDALARLAPAIERERREALERPSAAPPKSGCAFCPAPLSKARSRWSSPTAKA